jgi:flagellar hook protein FlgE
MSSALSSVSTIAASGLSAAQTGLRTHAHNLANLGTEGFRRAQTVSTALPGGGTLATEGRAQAPGHALLTDTVGLLQARHHFMANLAVFKTGDAMAGSLLNALA